MRCCCHRKRSTNIDDGVIVIVDITVAATAGAAATAAAAASMSANFITKFLVGYGVYMLDCCKFDWSTCNDMENGETIKH